jgi:hypothetical protein
MVRRVFHHHIRLGRQRLVGGQSFIRRMNAEHQFCAPLIFLLNRIEELAKSRMASVASSLAHFNGKVVFCNCDDPETSIFIITLFQATRNLN